MQFLDNENLLSLYSATASTNLTVFKIPIASFELMPGEIVEKATEKIKEKLVLLDQRFSFLN